MDGCWLLLLGLVVYGCYRFVRGQGRMAMRMMDIFDLLQAVVEDVGDEQDKEAYDDLCQQYQQQDGHFFSSLRAYFDVPTTRSLPVSLAPFRG